MENKKDSIEKLIEKANLGDAIAQLELGDCFEDGEGVEQDYAEAIRWYKLSAEQGYVEAEFALGFCYEFGVGVDEVIPKLLNGIN